MYRAFIGCLTLAIIITFTARVLLVECAKLPQISPVALSTSCERMNSIPNRLTVFLASFVVSFALILANMRFRKGKRALVPSLHYNLRSLFTFTLLSGIFIVLIRFAIF
jgi:hypothetical protein